MICDEVEEARWTHNESWHVFLVCGPITMTGTSGLLTSRFDVPNKTRQWLHLSGFDLGLCE